jgi:hypothetical protein
LLKIFCRRDAVVKTPNLAAVRIEHCPHKDLRVMVVVVQVNEHLGPILLNFLALIKAPNSVNLTELGT